MDNNIWCPPALSDKEFTALMTDLITDDGFQITDSLSGSQVKHIIYERFHANVLRHPRLFKWLFKIRN